MKVLKDLKQVFDLHAKELLKAVKNKAIFKYDTQYKCLQNKYNKNAICSSLDTCLHNQYNENATCSLLDTCLHNQYNKNAICCYMRANLLPLKSFYVSRIC